MLHLQCKMRFILCAKKFKPAQKFLAADTPSTRCGSIARRVFLQASMGRAACPLPRIYAGLQGQVSPRRGLRRQRRPARPTPHIALDLCIPSKFFLTFCIFIL